MSRIGKKAIPVPPAVTVNLQSGLVAVKGPKGQLECPHDKRFRVTIVEGVLTIDRPSDGKKDRALHGLYRALINNMVVGVTNGFKKTLEIQGVGYRAKSVGGNLELSLGYSHPVVLAIPQGISVAVDEKANRVEISGIDRQKVGQFAANIREVRRVEPYKGKGVRYLGESVTLKAGKSGKK